MSIEIIRTSEEISSKIDEIASNESNFTWEDENSDGCLEESFSMLTTQLTLSKFVTWLIGEE
jgi:hypothetical protein